MKTQRIIQIEKETCAGNKYRCNTHFRKDYHYAALNIYNDCELWEKAARSMAYAMTNQEIFVDEKDTIGGRVFQSDEIPVSEYEQDGDLIYEEKAHKAFVREFPEGEELIENQLVGGCAEGHITWFYDKILRLGFSGFKSLYEEALENAKDKEAEEFYKGVLIMIDAVLEFNDKYIEAYEKIGNHELAERMRKVPRFPAETFREAVQAFYMQHIAVMLENPNGGNGPGRLDHYLWPYLERDLKTGKCTLEDAREIIDELFLRFEERLYPVDGWVEAIVVGGTHPNGASAVNPLTYIMIESIMDLNVTHPSIYVRLPENPPEDLVELCAKYMMSGNNRAQILNDPSVINALVKRGTPYRDAVEYACGGCMEVHIQGMNSDFLYAGFQNVPKMLELMITGGTCLLTGKKLESFKAQKGLENYTDFESFYNDFIAEASRISAIYTRQNDIYSEHSQKARPSYLLSSMLDDCLERGRNMHAGGVKYHDYGASHIGMPDSADALYAIKKAVFDDKICTAKELVDALKADFKGYEKLQAKLRAIPKYGVDNDDVDALTARLMRDFSDTYLNCRTRWGGKAKPVNLTFVFGPPLAVILGATADGYNAHKLVAHAVTPHSKSMTEGITSAINSCSKMPFEKFAGGASSMWDFDSSWANEDIIKAVIKTFIAGNGQIFQGNTTSLDELIKAQDDPDSYKHIIVRVGGYSARFVTLENDFVENLWYLNLYYGNSEMKGKYPPHFCNGIWGNYHDFVPWNMYFHYNTQHAFNSYNATNHPELMETYFNFRSGQLDKAKHYAKEIKGTNGAFITDISDMLGRLVADDKELSKNCTCGAQIAMLMYKNYLYTGDKQFFTKKALPFMKEIGLFYLDMLKPGDDGLYHIYDTTAYEGSPPFDDCITDLCAIRALFSALIRESDSEESAVYKDRLEKLADFTATEMDEDETSDGKFVFGIGKGKEPKTNKVLTVGTLSKGAETAIRTNADAFGLPADINSDMPIRKTFGTAKKNMGSYYGFPDVEMAPVFPSGIVGIKDKGSDIYNMIYNSICMHHPALDGKNDSIGTDGMCMGWCMMPIYLARMGLSEELSEQLHRSASTWIAYPQGFGLYGPYAVGCDTKHGTHDTDIHSEVLRMEGEYRDKVVNYVVDFDRAFFNDKPEYISSVPLWNFRHFNYETMPILSSAVNEMLIQSYDGTIRLFGAVKKDARASFKLAAQGGFIISAIYENGDFCALIESERGEDLRIIFDNVPEPVKFTDADTGKELSIIHENGTYILNTQKGMKILAESDKTPEFEHDCSVNNNVKIMGDAKLGNARQF